MAELKSGARDSVRRGAVLFGALGVSVRGSAENSWRLEDISFALRTGTVTALMGPSGAGKSTLLKVLAGLRRPDEGSNGRGEVLYDGHGFYSSDGHIRYHIGYVPQDDILHDQLTVQKTLEFGAELRSRSHTPRDALKADVGNVLERLSLSGRADASIQEISGGERKRTSIALDLLMEQPLVLLLDEPTSGLDPDLERDIMSKLKMLAREDGCIVIFATHNPECLEYSDQVLFLAKNGKLAYFGPVLDPTQRQYLGAAETYPDTFERLRKEDTARNWLYAFREQHGAFFERSWENPLRGLSRKPGSPAGPTMRGAFEQFSTLIRRYFAVIFSDRRIFGLMLAAAVGCGLLLSWLSPSQIFDPEGPAESLAQSTTVAMSLVLVMTFLASFVAMNEIVKEAPIYNRERRLGLSIPAYVASKALMLGAITSIQAAILVSIFLLSQVVQGAAASPGLLVELWLDISLAGLGAMSLSLLISSLVPRAEWAAVLVALAVVFQFLLASPAFDVDNTPGLDQLSNASSAKWGLAAVASTVNLNHLVNIHPQSVTPQSSEGNDGRAEWAPGAWTSNVLWISGLAVVCVAGAGAVLYLRDKLLAASTDRASTRLSKRRVPIWSAAAVTAATIVAVVVLWAPGSTPVLSVAFSPDGTTFAAAYADGTVKLWSAGSVGEQLDTLSRNDIPAGDSMYSVAYSPTDGSRLVSGDGGGRVILWNALDGTSRIVGTHDGSVYGVAFSADGKTFASASEDTTVKIWDAATGEERSEFDPQVGEVLSIAFSPADNQTVAVGGQGTVRLYDIKADEPLGEPLDGHTKPVYSVAFSPDGKLLASGGFDETVRLWDVSADQPRGELLEGGHDGAVYSVAFSPDGTSLAAGGKDERIIVWNVASGDVQFSVTDTAPVRGVAYSQLGVLASGKQDGTVKLWNPQSPETIAFAQTATMRPSKSCSSADHHPINDSRFEICTS